MKRLRVIFVLCLVPVWLSACGETAESGESDIVPIESVKMDNSAEGQEEDLAETGSNLSLVSYVGVYNDYDNDEPNLEISQNEDGSYAIQLGIFRLLSLDDGLGQDTGDGIRFISNEWGLEGIITLEGDVATVTFEGDFPYSDIREYKYYRTSDKP